MDKSAVIEKLLDNRRPRLPAKWAKATSEIEDDPEGERDTVYYNGVPVGSFDTPLGDAYLDGVFKSGRRAVYEELLKILNPPPLDQGQAGRLARNFSVIDGYREDILSEFCDEIADCLNDNGQTITAEKIEEEIVSDIMTEARDATDAYKNKQSGGKTDIQIIAERIADIDQQQRDLRSEREGLVKIVDESIGELQQDGEISCDPSRAITLYIDKNERIVDKKSSPILKIVIPKQDVVQWDQDECQRIHDFIISSGKKSPFRQKFDMTETKYKNMTAEQQQFLSSSRKIISKHKPITVKTHE